MSENNQEDGVIIDLIQQMIRKLLEIRSAQPASIKMMATRISLNRSQNQIQFSPKRRKNPFRCFCIMYGDFADVSGKFWVANYLHRL